MKWRRRDSNCGSVATAPKSGMTNGQVAVEPVPVVKSCRALRNDGVS